MLKVDDLCKEDASREEIIEALFEENKRLIESMKMIGTKCENYTAPSTCWTAGRTPGAEFGSEAVCAPCIAARALAPNA